MGKMMKCKHDDMDYKGVKGKEKAKGKELNKVSKVKGMTNADESEGKGKMKMKKDESSKGQMKNADMGKAYSKYKKMKK